jgi:hypothetical protein
MNKKMNKGLKSIFIIATFFLINDLNPWHLEEIHGYGQKVNDRFSRGCDFRIGNSLDDFK